MKVITCKIKNSTPFTNPWRALKTKIPPNASPPSGYLSKTRSSAPNGAKKSTLRRKRAVHLVTTEVCLIERGKQGKREGLNAVVTRDTDITAVPFEYTRMRKPKLE